MSRRWGLERGARLGRYEILQGLARGGMGEVYLARMHTDAGAHKLVAIKRILPHHLDDEEVRQMFFREGRIALQLDHPNVVQIFDLAEIDDEHIMSMEYIRGESLRSLTKTVGEAAEPSSGERGGGKALPLAVSLRILEQVADALDYVHGARSPEREPLHLLHRDLSPENVMVRYDGGVKLIDFGIARMAQQTFATKVDVMKGKMGYMSPEQLRQDPLDPRSDIYQLGILAFELTTGRRLFDGPNFAAVMNQVLSGEVDAPSSVVPDYPPALEAIVLQALSFEPEDRQASAAEFGRAVASLARELDLSLTNQSVAQELRRRFPEADAPATVDAAPEAPTRVTGRKTVATRAQTRSPAILGAAVATLLLAAAAVIAGVGVERASSESAALLRWRAQWVASLASVVALGAVAVLRQRRPNEEEPTQ